MIPVNIVVGRFQPLTMGHLKCAEEARRQTGLPTVLCMIETPLNKLDSKHPFPSTLTLPLYMRLLKDHKDIVGIVLVKNADIVKISEKLREMGWQIGSWTCGTDRARDYRRIMDSYRDKANLAPGAGVIEVSRPEGAISATAVREMIKTGDMKGFLEQTPWGRTIKGRSRASQDFELLSKWINRLERRD